jgi:2,5-furandicarboxylate decarboxylase 1
LPIATVIGVEPAFTLASCIGAPEGVDETEIAGAIQRTPIEMIKCETIDVTVPANAEIIIEGITVPDERVPCGPFGEFSGNYITLFGALTREVHVIEVTAITMRKDPIFQAMLSGMPITENHTLKNWSYAATEYRVINKLADVKALNLTPGGCYFYHLVVAINKRDDEEPKKIIESLLFARHGPTLVIVVDDDINIYDPFEVEWAIATRVSPTRDITIFPGVINQQGTRGPGKWGIDATVPCNEKEFYEKIRIPGMENVDYI